MKKTFLTFLLLLPLVAFSQLSFQLQGEVSRMISNELPQGAKVGLIYISLGFSGTPTVATISKEDGNTVLIPLNELKRISFFPKNSQEFWQVKAIENGVYDNLVQKGVQYDLRLDLERDALDYLNYLERNDLIFNDDYFESYLQTLAFKIYPGRIEDDRPGNLNFKIVKDNTPNAFAFPNGTIILTTGLLSTFNSEDELIGVLAHEISHFVLDHSVININLEAQRKRRAEFWAGLATTLAAATEAYVVSQNEYYLPGNLTLGTAMLAYSIAESATERLGLRYSRQQELAADLCATELMEFIGIEPTALSSALEKIKAHFVLKGKYQIFSEIGTHPNIEDRITEIGVPSKSFNDAAFDTKISLFNSYNAILNFNDKHFETAENLVRRNIRANVATEEDYVLLAASIMNMYDSEQKNQEALELLQKARTLNVYPTVNLPKQEAMAFIRLGRLAEAKKSLEEYREALKKEWIEFENILDPDLNTAIRSFLSEEDEWTAKMIQKVNLL